MREIRSGDGQVVRKMSPGDCQVVRKMEQLRDRIQRFLSLAGFDAKKGGDDVLPGRKGGADSAAKKGGESTAKGGGESAGKKGGGEIDPAAWLAGMKRRVIRSETSRYEVPRVALSGSKRRVIRISGSELEPCGIFNPGEYS